VYTVHWVRINFLLLHLHLHSNIYKPKIHQMTEGHKTFHNNVTTIHSEGARGSVVG